MQRQFPILMLLLATGMLSAGELNAAEMGGDWWKPAEIAQPASSNSFIRYGQDRLYIRDFLRYLGEEPPRDETHCRSISYDALQSDAKISCSDLEDGFREFDIVDNLPRSGVNLFEVPPAMMGLSKKDQRTYRWESITHSERILVVRLDAPIHDVAEPLKVVGYDAVLELREGDKVLWTQPTRNTFKVFHLAFIPHDDKTLLIVDLISPGGSGYGLKLVGLFLDGRWKSSPQSRNEK